MTLTYSSLNMRTDFMAKFRYLKLGGQVGVETFGHDRWLNQRFYSSPEWKSVRDAVILRDNGCDLGVPDRLIHDKILVHHMNPISVVDLKDFNEDILNPEYLISVTIKTHNAIHFGDERLLPRPLIERMPGDTVPW